MFFSVTRTCTSCRWLMVASSVVSIVKLAHEMARTDQQDQIAALEQRLEELVVDGKVRR